MYLAMALNSALLLLLRSFSAALFMIVSMKFFLAYMAVDVALYLAQKLLRVDFLYWAPVEGVKGLAVSLLVRVMSKVLADYTGIIQMRGPGELVSAARAKRVMKHASH